MVNMYKVFSKLIFKCFFKSFHPLMTLLVSILILLKLYILRIDEDKFLLKYYFFLLVALVIGEAYYLGMCIYSEFNLLSVNELMLEQKVKYAITLAIEIYIMETFDIRKEIYLIHLILSVIEIALLKFQFQFIAFSPSKNNDDQFYFSMIIFFYLYGLLYFILFISLFGFIYIPIKFLKIKASEKKFNICNEILEELKIYSLILGQNLEVTSFTRIFQLNTPISPFEWIYKYSRLLILSDRRNNEGKEDNLWEIIVNINNEVVRCPFEKKNFSGDFIYKGTNSLFIGATNEAHEQKILKIRIVYLPEYSSKRMKFLLLIEENVSKNDKKEFNDQILKNEYLDKTLDLQASITSFLNNIHEDKERGSFLISLKEQYLLYFLSKLLYFHQLSFFLLNNYKKIIFPRNQLLLENFLNEISSFYHEFCKLKGIILIWRLPQEKDLTIFTDKIIFELLIFKIMCFLWE